MEEKELAEEKEIMETTAGRKTTRWKEERKENYRRVRHEEEKKIKLGLWGGGLLSNITYHKIYVQINNAKNFC